MIGLYVFALVLVSMLFGFLSIPGWKTSPWWLSGSHERIEFWSKFKTMKQPFKTFGLLSTIFLGIALLIFIFGNIIFYGARVRLQLSPATYVFIALLLLVIGFVLVLQYSKKQRDQ